MGFYWGNMCLVNVIIHLHPYAPINVKPLGGGGGGGGGGHTQGNLTF